MDKKQVMQTILDKLGKLSKKLGNLLILALALVAGFVIGYYYWMVTNKSQKTEWENIKALSETSVAINERNELLVIDRKSGVYSIYQDSIGIVIFNLYANRIYKQAAPTVSAQQ
jgi:predicted negative regulator of RcsB-dependent stress response